MYNNQYPNWSVNKLFCSRENNLSELSGNYITGATHKKTEYDLECWELYKPDKVIQFANPNAKPLQEKFYNNGKYIMKIYIVDGEIKKDIIEDNTEVYIVSNPEYQLELF